MSSNRASEIKGGGEIGGNNSIPVKYYSVAVIFLILGLVGIQWLFLKTDLPFKYDDDLICIYEYGDVYKGDIVKKVDGVPVNNKFQLEFILDHKQIGDQVKLNVLNGGNSEKNVSVQLSGYCNPFFIYISLFIGLAFWLSSVFVISKRRDEKSARLIYWIFLIYSLAIMTALAPNESTAYSMLSLLLRIVHEVTYLLGVILYIHFTFIFPREKFHNKKIGLTFIYLPSVIISMLLSVSIIYGHDNVNYDWLNLYYLLSKIVRIYLVLGIIFCTVNLVLSYRRFNAAADKRKIEWIFWGVSAGVIPFIVLWVIPEILGLSTVNEEIPLSFLIFVPVSFVIAVLKYRLFDIEFIIKRSIVYAVLSVFILLLYFGLVAVITNVSYGLLGESNTIVSLVVTFMIVFLFNPVRIKVKGFVDKTFYRVKYDINKAVGFFVKELKESNTLAELGNVTISEIQKLIPVSKIALALADESEDHLTILTQNNFDELSRNITALRIKKIDASFMLPFALADKVEHGIEISFALDNVLKRWDVNLAMPLILESREVIGVLILGNKLSNIRYSNSDIELLNIIATQIAFAVKRLQLREKLVFEGIERSRLEELNNLKSFFVSRVSHDLKTPLTSIIMFAKILQSKKRVVTSKRTEYLKIIEGESTRLTRLIDNILNFAKIEKGIKEYKLEEIEMNEVIKEVINLVKYELKMHKFKMKVNYCRNKCFIFADSDAVIEALMNIISNSIKYSAEKKKILLTAFEENSYACIKISDEGRGIPQDSLKIIFEPFYRSKDAFFNRVNGTGLGLAIVKHIMESHKGKINVESELGKGTSFTLAFPEKIS